MGCTLHKVRMILKLAIAGLVAVSLAGCSSDSGEGNTNEVVVTYSVLGSLVSELVGDAATVRVIIPDGSDLHTFSPSAKDVEAMTNAKLVVANGLHLEEGLEDVLDTLPEEQLFFAGDHLTIRTMDGSDDGHNHEGESTKDSHGHGADDPHFWLSPFAMTEMLDDLAAALETALSIAITDRAVSLIDRLSALDTEIAGKISALPACELVTGHEEMGYFADRYGCKVIGAVIPASTTNADASASQLAELKELVTEHDVRAIFSGVGTPANVAEQIAKETGVPLVKISTHVMGDDDTYASFMTRFVDTLVGALS